MTPRTIIIPFTLPWDWSADYQRQTALELARKNYWVTAYMAKDTTFFLKALITTPPPYPKHKNVDFYRPLSFLPFRRFACIDYLNQRISFLFFLITQALHQPILWIFDPEFYFLPKAFAGPSLYDCVDYHWSPNKGQNQLKSSQQTRLIRSVTHFIVNSRTLCRLHKHIRKPDFLAPQGFRLNDFQKPSKNFFHFSTDKPIIGYVGAINHRLDFKLITALVKNSPQLTFVLWGKVQETDPKQISRTMKALKSLSNSPNFITGLSKNRREIPHIINQFSIGTIPYVETNQFNKYCYPMKLFEYFYLGKSVVSSAIEELTRFPNLVTIASTPKEWQTALDKLLSTSWPKKNIHKQNQLAINNSWSNKVDQILNFIKV